MEKICSACGNILKDNALFCSKCGNKYIDKSTTILKCSNCGLPININAKFCPNCGQKHESKTHQDATNYIKKGFHDFTSTINNMTEEKGAFEVDLKMLFSGIFKKHSLKEREELFICGTTNTTPMEKDMITEWPKPWLYTRIFLMFTIIFVSLLFVIEEFSNTNAIPGAMFIGALLIPFSLVVFFWEMNIPRNISIFEVVSTFFIGGVLSLISTLFIYQMVGVGQLDYLGAVLVGFTEEAGKIIVVAYYIRKKNSKYILNGLLLGACIGAGFAVFETAGYAFTALLQSFQISDMIHVLFLRAVLSIGGHTTWTAIAAVGLIVAKGNSPLQRQHFFDAKFLKFLILVIALHAIWDMPIEIGSSYHIVQWTLTCIAVIIVLVLLSSGLRQASKISEKAIASAKAKNQIIER
ncbi:PrsW family glutamic-type intramembrane protease [Extibacter muris]|uniref:PrsW family glutamic-type intramembrane protease n=1 Tax=Extibacter muris TaxID=1796622 RepID=UPI001D092B26|nr:PrsW family glutamic-type intramembrane protease [Extibacter muris]MCB6201073.1 PrsW family intramembrane metalloprotease [Extibacter muris]MCQ4662403.1 PrsW family glutamic-type intramembrane protease [Extibacter muris]MCQ4691670.1 PrsW family glutamic-type intramembrane protease [Extibacter muris]